MSVEALVRAGQRIGYDSQARYQLTCAVSRRSDTRIQIGSEPPGWVVLCDAPPESVPVLRGLDGTVPAGQVLSRHGGDPQVWTPIFEVMLERGLLSPTGAAPGADLDPLLRPEWWALARVHGPAAAHRLLSTRAEALVEVRGSGRLPGAVAVLLAAAGVGHVHQRLDRRLRPGDHLDEVSGPTGHPSDAADEADRWTVNRRLRAVSGLVRTHPPATHHHPDLVLLASDVTEPAMDAAELCLDAVAHLVATAGGAQAVLGPLVLPGRSACLRCLALHRMDADPEWMPARSPTRRAPAPPAALVAAVAASAAVEVLALVDGAHVPATVDGTVEWRYGELTPRRRSWYLHPECGCQGG